MELERVASNPGILVITIETTGLGEELVASLGRGLDFDTGQVSSGERPCAYLILERLARNNGGRGGGEDGEGELHRCLLLAVD